MSQPHLLDPLGSDLPSPVFTPRPGWGGQFRRWLRQRGATIFFRGVIIIALCITALALWHQPESPQATVSPVTPTPIVEVPIIIPVKAGDGMSAIAVRAIDAYLALPIAMQSSYHLDSLQHLIAVDALVRSTPAQTLHAGDTVSFSLHNVQVAIDVAAVLTPPQRAAWLRWVRGR